MTQTPIDLIVGLGNPGLEYAKTRHNAGAWFVEKLATTYQQTLKNEPKLGGFCGALKIHDRICRLLIPNTYMNLSGQSVRALADFYKISAQAILVVHDELDFSPGIARIKQGGGHGGHKGLSNIIQHINTHDFYRLRLGIGHPGNRALVSNYVLSRPTPQESSNIQTAIDRSIILFEDLAQGDFAKVTQQLHQNLV